jgi:hypothetical protein
MKAKEFIIVEAKVAQKPKPRNPVAKNLGVTTSGAGQHKDRKAAEKRGEVKHKGKSLGESNSQILPPGYNYEPYDEVDDDTRKIYHMVRTPDGKQVRADFSPYEKLKDSDIAVWIKLGMPDRKGLGLNGPIEKDHLYKLAQEKGVAEAFGLYGPFTVTINTGERPQSRTITKKFRREDDAILWAEDWFEDAPQFVYATAEITDPEGNVVWYSDETMASGRKVSEDQVTEVSKDYAERERAGSQIAKILDNNKGTQWDDYTPEQLKQIQQLAKITGRRHGIWQSKKLGREMQVGRIVDLMSKYVQQKQRDSGQMPEFTGRAATAKDMANQIALQTNGDATWRPGTTWTSGRTGTRHRDPQDHVLYKDKQSYNDAWQWIESKGKKVHYKNNFDDLRTAIQIGSYIVEPSSRTRSPFGAKPETEYSVSVRSVKAIGQPTRTKQDITDQQAAAIRDIANTRGENAMKMIQALIDVLDGEQDVKRVIDQSKKIDPRDKAKLDKIIAGAGNFKESKKHISPSGVETNMAPTDDDYAINYGKDGNVAKFRKKQGLDVKTGNKKVDEVDMSSPEFQRLLKSVGEKANQGPKKTVYDPKTGKYKVVPVNAQGNKNG